MLKLHNQVLLKIKFHKSETDKKSVECGRKSVDEEGIFMDLLSAEVLKSLKVSNTQTYICVFTALRHNSFNFVSGQETKGLCFAPIRI